MTLPSLPLRQTAGREDWRLSLGAGWSENRLRHGKAEFAGVAAHRSSALCRCNTTAAAEGWHPAKPEALRE